MIYVEMGFRIIDALDLSFWGGDSVVEVKLNVACMWY